MALVPPVERDGFSFAGGDLFAEASGHNRHRRASPAELQTHFGTGSDKDRPAHWFEAQLIHYGLQPSKTKAVARMRLHDAVRAGGLAVPARVQKLETDLKKQWTKNERDAKKALSGGGGPSSSAASTTGAAAAAKKGTKRKAEETIDLTVSVGGVDIKVSKSTKTSSSSTTASAAAVAKKAKTTKSTTAATPKAKAPKSTTTTTTTTTPKSKAQASASKPKSTSRAPSSSASTPAKPSAKKPAARRGGISQGPGRGGAASSSTTTTTSRPPRTKQTARRSGAFAARGRIEAPGTSYGGGGDFGYDGGPPPPYSEYANEPTYSREGDGDHKPSYGGGSYDSDDQQESSSGDVELRPLGLLNGRYAVYSPDVTSQWDQWDDGDFELVLTLSGSELWGRFNLGVVRGVLRLAQRPWDASHDRLRLAWRGREHEGPMLYGDRNGGWLRFLGGGRVEGEIDFMRLGFQAERLSGQGTRSEADIADLRSEWNAYNEREYEEENRARWR
ncbi:hypothetical protein MGN70_007987 [Eutypa lata]|nr:hypothetical protein MGN70_007987 [Eutypa lata]